MPDFEREGRVGVVVALVAGMKGEVEGDADLEDAEVCVAVGSVGGCDDAGKGDADAGDDGDDDGEGDVGGG